jgi:hypothetical protein
VEQVSFDSSTFSDYGQWGAAISLDEKYLYLTDSTNKNIKIIKLEDMSVNIFYSDNSLIAPRGICVHSTIQNIIYVSKDSDTIIKINHASAYTGAVDLTYPGVCQDNSYDIYDIGHDSTYMYVLCGKSDRGKIMKLRLSDNHISTVISSFGNSIVPQNWVLVQSNTEAYITMHKNGLNPKVARVILSDGSYTILSSDGMLYRPRGISYNPRHDVLYIQGSDYKGLIGLENVRDTNYPLPKRQVPITVPLRLPAEYPIKNFYIESYEIIMSGTCNEYVTESNDCEEAATYLKFSDKTVSDDGESNSADDPKGCYYEGNVLKLNVNMNNNGVCSVTRRCLCKIHFVWNLYRTKTIFKVKV